MYDYTNFNFNISPLCKATSDLLSHTTSPNRIKRAKSFTNYARSTNNLRRNIRIRTLVVMKTLLWWRCKYNDDSPCKIFRSHLQKLRQNDRDEFKIQLSLPINCIQWNCAFLCRSGMFCTFMLIFHLFILHHNKAIIHEQPWGLTQFFRSSELR